jgi:hypothetical protein
MPILRRATAATIVVLITGLLIGGCRIPERVPQLTTQPCGTLSLQLTTPGGKVIDSSDDIFDPDPGLIASGELSDVDNNIDGNCRVLTLVTESTNNTRTYKSILQAGAGKFSESLTNIGQAKRATITLEFVAAGADCFRDLIAAKDKDRMALSNGLPGSCPAPSKVVTARAVRGG